jgi:hypothetical protein
MVIVPAGEIAPPTVGTKRKVADTPVFPAKRSASETVNDVNDTRSPMLPLAHVSRPLRSES